MSATEYSDDTKCYWCNCRYCDTWSEKEGAWIHADCADDGVHSDESETERCEVELQALNWGQPIAEGRHANTTALEWATVLAYSGKKVEWSTWTAICEMLCAERKSIYRRLVAEEEDDAAGA